MLKKLRTKFFATSMLTIFAVITIVVGSINVFNVCGVIWSAEDTAAAILGKSVDTTNSFKDLFIKLTHNMKTTPVREAKYFYVVLTEGKPAQVEPGTMKVSDNSAISMARKAIDEESKIGLIGKTGYKIYKSGKETTIFFLDCTNQINSAKTFFELSVSISFFSLLIIYIVIWVISSRIVGPISEGYEKQKRFITDAGHDLKTPITIINSDAELLEMEIGENEWLSDIKKQSERLAELTSELIYLSKMEEKRVLPHSDFPLSDTAEEVVNSFSALAITKRIMLFSSISPALYYHGHEDSIKKLFSLLLDNAIKYSPEGERVDFIVKKQGRTIMVQVSNLAPNVSAKSVEHMFDRFYRSDPSRSSSGGFGIGLSVAKAIVSSHQGRIYAKKNRDTLVIDVILF